MTEFAQCPGRCDAKVRVWDGGVVNFCCHNCWRWYWENGVMNTAPFDNYGAFLPHHTEQCDKRQLARTHEKSIGGEFVLNIRNTPPLEDWK